MKQFSSLSTAVILASCFALLQPATAQQSSINPHGEIKLGISCNSCHLTEAWTPLKDEISFYHSMQTGFPLTGSHTQTACASCHIGLKFDQPKSATTECASCHIDVHQGSLGEHCVDCHNTTLFQDVEGIALHAQTSFPLAGTHAQLNCVSCHTDDVNGAFTPLDTQCITCHQADYDNAQSVDHLAAGFPTECETCHNDLQWQGTLFDHVIASSGFDLIGAHDRLQCASCHRSPDLTPIFTATNDQQCIDCHQDDYDDEHAGSGFPVTCLECHNQDTWDDAVFDHIASSNGFALLGAHETANCSTCHSIPEMAVLFQPPPSSDQDCVTCHQSEYDDNHAGTGFPTMCLECHNTNTWEDADFSHVTASNGFDLLGAHDVLQCESCHSMPDLAVLFQPPPSSDQDCLTCHQADYDGEHAGSGFPTTCLECHNTTTWADADFSHVTASNGFDLIGAHDVLQCESCHSMPDLGILFQPPPSSDQDCITCHQQDYDNEHAGSGFSTACLDCHTTETWDGAEFDHDALFFPIYSGNHRGEWNNNCASCHTQPNNFAFFSCDGACHEHTQSEMNNEHNGVNGYAFDFPLCLSCHPNGN